MQTFQLFIDDDRYSVPTLDLVTVDDPYRALEVAEKRMRESQHHRGVEVLLGDTKVFGLGTFADRPRS